MCGGHYIVCVCVCVCVCVVGTILKHKRQGLCVMGTILKHDCVWWALY